MGYQIRGFEASTFFTYHFLRLGQRYRFFAHHQVIIHREGHMKGLFKERTFFLNNINQIIASPFYGSMPMNYPTAHNKIHHRWHNDVDDTSTNCDLDRTNPASVMLYIPRFFLYWTSLAALWLFFHRKEWEFFWPCLYGVLYYVAWCTFIWKLAGTTFLICFVIYPLFESTAFLGSISYLWHVFIDPSDPTNQYVNSITILNGKDNIWNEDYHVVHHHACHIHWSDVANYYKKTEHLYAENQATIFRDTEQGEILMWLFTKNWDKMAAHFVDLNGKLTFEEKKALILRRLRFRVAGGGLKEWGKDSTIVDYDDEGINYKKDE